MICINFGKNLITIFTGMFIALPCINGIAFSRKTGLDN